VPAIDRIVGRGGGGISTIYLLNLFNFFPDMPGFSALASASKSALRSLAFCPFAKGIIISTLESDGTAAGGGGGGVASVVLLLSALRGGGFGIRRCLRSRVGLYFDGIVRGGGFAPGGNLVVYYTCLLVDCL